MTNTTQTNEDQFFLARLFAMFTPRAPMPESQRPEPKIFSLPVEIRQQILEYAFYEAIEQDIAFNANLQKTLTPLSKEADCVPEYLLRWRTFERIYNEDATCRRWHACPGCLECCRAVSFHEVPPRIPRIHAMANKLSAVHPQLREEGKFVFERCLDQFRLEEARLRIQEVEKPTTRELLRQSQ